ncbi:hypothetical protein QN277_008591 [Acacia crassicarpa]|uniref:Uncharacterized protein n=1 Tax=Acacia crassicarpa TaxID=499986 RepID=A0AAE1IQT1_9FABA|nr:hypothetical protein QN277_008591 [Acacia crassicarpa]
MEARAAVIFLEFCRVAPVRVHHRGRLPRPFCRWEPVAVSCYSGKRASRIFSMDSTKALMLTDSRQRKLPPNHPPAEGHDDRKKKKKTEEALQAIMDDKMSDSEIEQLNEQVKKSGNEETSGKKED